MSTINPLWAVAQIFAVPVCETRVFQAMLRQQVIQEWGCSSRYSRRVARRPRLQGRALLPNSNLHPVSVIYSCYQRLFTAVQCIRENQPGAIASFFLYLDARIFWGALPFRGGWLPHGHWVGAVRLAGHSVRKGYRHQSDISVWFSARASGSLIALNNYQLLNFVWWCAPQSWPVFPVIRLRWWAPVAVLRDASGLVGVWLKVGSEETDNNPTAKG